MPDIETESGSESDGSSVANTSSTTSPMYGQTTRCNRTNGSSEDNGSDQPHHSPQVIGSHSGSPASPTRQCLSQAPSVEARSRAALDSEDNFDENLHTPHRSHSSPHINGPRGCNNNGEDFSRHETARAYVQQVRHTDLPAQGGDRHSGPQITDTTELEERHKKDAEQQRDRGRMDGRVKDGMGDKKREFGKTFKVRRDIRQICIDNNMHHTYELFERGGHFNFGGLSDFS